MAGSRHCPGCGVRWPEGWTRCPACQQMTAFVRREPNRSKYQACEADFERRYAEREERRIGTGHIAPEAIGKREAREIIELEHDLASSPTPQPPTDATPDPTPNDQVA